MNSNSTEFYTRRVRVSHASKSAIASREFYEQLSEASQHEERTLSYYKAKYMPEGVLMVSQETFERIGDTVILNTLDEEVEVFGTGAYSFSHHAFVSPSELFKSELTGRSTSAKKPDLILAHLCRVFFVHASNNALCFYRDKEMDDVFFAVPLEDIPMTLEEIEDTITMYGGYNHEQKGEK